MFDIKLKKLYVAPALATFTMCNTNMHCEQLPQMKAISKTFLKMTHAVKHRLSR